MTDVTNKFTFAVETRAAVINQPAVFAVVPFDAVLYTVRFTLVKRLVINIYAMLQVIRMYVFGPAAAQLLFKRPSGEFEPNPVEIIAKHVGS